MTTSDRDQWNSPPALNRNIQRPRPSPSETVSWRRDNKGRGEKIRAAFRLPSKQSGNRQHSQGHTTKHANFLSASPLFPGTFRGGIHVYEAIVVGVPRTVSVSETRYRLHPCNSGECLPLVCKRNDIPAYARNWCLTAKHAQWQAKLTTA